MWLCKVARQHFSDVIDGHQLPQPTRLYVGMHRTICPMCIRYEASLRGTMAAARELRNAWDVEATGESEPKKEADKP